MITALYIHFLEIAYLLFLIVSNYAVLFVNYGGQVKTILGRVENTIPSPC